MQITIVQAEIETAIRNYIQEQIVVREGMKIDIDLRATRGDAGFMATIDIVPVSAAKVEQDTTAHLLASAANAEHLKRSTEQLRTGKASPRALAEAPVTVTTIAPADLPDTGAVEAIATAKEEQNVPSEAAQAEVATEAVAETAAAPAPRAGSLFANLKKPQNT